MLVLRLPALSRRLGCPGLLDLLDHVDGPRAGKTLLDVQLAGPILVCSGEDAFDLFLGARNIVLLQLE